MSSIHILLLTSQVIDYMINERDKHLVIALVPGMLNLQMTTVLDLVDTWCLHALLAQETMELQNIHSTGDQLTLPRSKHLDQVLMTKLVYICISQ